MARYRRRLSLEEKGAAAIGVALLLASHTAPARTVAATAGVPSHAAAVAIAYAKHQIGAPYVWGGTGPGGYDCSGLVMEAYADAGITIPRTSQMQWAGLRHIPPSQVQPGDLVFFPGADGTWSAPGHVAMVISRTRMVQAYDTGTPIEVSPLNGDGSGGIVGYARPS